MASAAQHARSRPATGPRESSPARNKLLAAVHATWHKLRPDLHHDKQMERDERIAFVNGALKFRREVTSMRSLSDAQLRRVLDALRRMEMQPALVGYTPPAWPREAEQTGNVVHLATAEQTFTLDKLFEHLDWTEEFRARFVERRFKRAKHQLLTPAQANSLTRILMNIAASRDIKARGVAGKVSRAMIATEIPALKRRLQIDAKPERKEASYEWCDPKSR